eukprot:jgi/Ulvmu1/8649/UM046_0054.1
MLLRSRHCPGHLPPALLQLLCAVFAACAALGSSAAHVEPHAAKASLLRSPGTGARHSRTPEAAAAAMAEPLSRSTAARAADAGELIAVGDSLQQDEPEYAYVYGDEYAEEYGEWEEDGGEFVAEELGDGAAVGNRSSIRQRADGAVHHDDGLADGGLSDDDGAGAQGWRWGPADVEHGCHSCKCLPRCRSGRCNIKRPCQTKRCTGHCKWPKNSTRGRPNGACRLGNCSRLGPASAFGRAAAPVVHED